MLAPCERAQPIRSPAASRRSRSRLKSQLDPAQYLGSWQVAPVTDKVEVVRRDTANFSEPPHVLLEHGNADALREELPRYARSMTYTPGGRLSLFPPRHSSLRHVVSRAQAASQYNLPARIDVTAPHGLARRLDAGIFDDNVHSPGCNSMQPRNVGKAHAAGNCGADGAIAFNIDGRTAAPAD